MYQQDPAVYTVNALNRWSTTGCIYWLEGAATSTNASGSTTSGVSAIRVTMCYTSTIYQIMYLKNLIPIFIPSEGIKAVFKAVLIPRLSHDD